MKRLLLVSLSWAVTATAEEPSVTYLTDETSDRVPVETVVPAYPKDARRDRIEGDVQVCFHIDRNGKPYRIAVRKSTNRVFEKPARRAVRASRYKALEEGEKASGIKSCRTFRFTLEPVKAEN
jgi:TonB family protein